MKRPLWIISLALIGACTWLMPARAASPTAYVRGILDKVMAIQNDPALSNQARAKAIHQIIGRSFDFNLMAKDSLGGTYGRLSGAQQQEFTRTFSFLFQDSYTRLVLNFLKKENIQYGQERQQGDKAQVDTAIVRTNENIPVINTYDPTFADDNGPIVNGNNNTGQIMNDSPLFADDVTAATMLYVQLAEFAEGGAVFLDVPENNPSAMELVHRYAMKEVFGCARMYLGPAPDIAHHRIFGVTTFELG